MQYDQYACTGKRARWSEKTILKWWKIYLSALVFLLPLVTVAFIALPSVVRASGSTIANDALRTGWYAGENQLTANVVGSGKFGALFDTAIDGQVYAQPLVSNGVLLIVSETNHVYGLNATTGAQIWARSLGTPFNAQDVSCSDLAPSIGITGTPVIDPATKHAYFFSKTYLNGSAVWYIHAIDVASGVEQPGFPLLIQGTATNDPTQTFNAKFEMQRPGLVLSGGMVYAAFGGHCDRAPYEGWVVGVSTSGVSKTLWTDEAGVSATDAPGAGGIWMSGGGLVSDGVGSILFSSGNGDVPLPNTPGHADTPGTLGQSVVRLATQRDGSLKATDFFSPYDADQLNVHDYDLGSGGLMELPPGYFGTQTYPHILLQAGKEGYLYMLNADDLGGRGQSVTHADAVINRIETGNNGLWSKPSVWPGDGGYVYMVTARRGKASGNLDAYRYVLDNAGKPTLKKVGSAADAYGFGSSSPVISSLGTTSGSALVWSIWSADGTGQGAQLRAYDPVPVDGVLKLRYSSAIGVASKFNSPLIENNRVYVGTQDGHVLAFGAMTSPLFPLSGAPLNLGTVIDGQSGTGTLDLSANAAVTVSAVSLDNTFFTLGTITPTLPATLTAGQHIQIPVTFAPTNNYVQGADVSVTTSQGASIFSAEGRGENTSGKLKLSQAPISMGGALLGAAPLIEPLTLSNIGAQSGALTGITLPHAPFSVSGFSVANAPIAPGASITGSVIFTPTSAGSFSDTLILMTTSGEIDVPLSATAGTGGVLTVAPLAVDAGSIAVGATQKVKFTISNTGIRPVTITSSLPPGAGVGFIAHSILPVGTVLQPGAVLQERVIFAPIHAGSVTDSWVIGSDDGTGVKTINFTGSGTAASSSNKK